MGSSLLGRCLRRVLDQFPAVCAGLPGQNVRDSVEAGSLLVDLSSIMPEPFRDIVVCYLSGGRWFLIPRLRYTGTGRFDWPPLLQNKGNIMSKRLLSIFACLAILPSAGAEVFAQGRPGGPPGGGGGAGQRGGGAGQRGGGAGQRGGGAGQRGGGGGGQRGGRGGSGGGGFEQMMRMMPVIKALDKDGDGVLSKAEIANATAALKSLDKNKDGKLEGGEIQPDFSAFRGGRGGPGGGGPGGGQGERGSRGGREGGGGSRNVSQMIDRIMQYDKDKDGKLSKDEIPERMAGMTENADSNKDGFLDKAELEERLKSFGGRGGRPGGGGGERGGSGRGGRGGDSGGGNSGGDRPRRPGGE